MAGMNLHQIGIEPRVLRYEVDPETHHIDPEMPPLYGNNRAYADYLNHHGIDEVVCDGCGSHTFHRIIRETWSRREAVMLTTRDHLRYEDEDVAADISSAEYEDDQDEDEWECSGCNQRVRDLDILGLLTDLDKEPY